MNLRFNIVLAAWLAFIPFAVPAALADGGQPAAAAAAEIPAQASMVCPQPDGKKLNLAQTSPADCCKAHKGVCGCRAGKIICCDRTPSDQPGCTCHGDDGFLE
jgi:hypothetical protein